MTVEEFLGVLRADLIFLGISLVFLEVLKIFFLSMYTFEFSFTTLRSIISLNRMVELAVEILSILFLSRVDFLAVLFIMLNKQSNRKIIEIRNLNQPFHHLCFAFLIYISFRLHCIYFTAIFQLYDFHSLTIYLDFIHETISIPHLISIAFCIKNYSANLHIHRIQIMLTNALIHSFNQ